MKKELYYGDNLDILRNKIASDSVDLCYIDPPFNSKKDYNIIYNNQSDTGNAGGGVTLDRAQSQAFVDTWEWGNKTDDYFNYLTDPQNINSGSVAKQTCDLIKGLRLVFGKNDLMAYLVSMAVRIIEIHRVLKPTGSFYLHCDPTASHYIKILVDSIFLTKKGEFRNEIVWHYTGGGRSKSYFSWKHDLIFCYSKTLDTSFNIDDIRVPYKETSGYAKSGIISKSGKKYMPNPLGTPMDDVWNIPIINPMAKERLGLETQKPEALLEIIIKASSNEGDVVLDAFCGCGTTVAVAERLKRQWIGIDISYQQISLIFKRLYDSCANDNQWKALDKQIKLGGVPQDMESARALANKKDDRLRKEFEKWAVLTYANNRAIINDKKGADGGIDGEVYFVKNDNREIGKAVFQVKSGKVQRGDIAKLNADRQKFNAEIGFFITLDDPTKPMIDEVKSAGKFNHPLYPDKPFNRIEIITIEDMIDGKRIELPMTRDVLKSAERADKNQMTLDI